MDLYFQTLPFHGGAVHHSHWAKLWISYDDTNLYLARPGEIRIQIKKILSLLAYIPTVQNWLGPNRDHSNGSIHKLNLNVYHLNKCIFVNVIKEAVVSSKTFFKKMHKCMYITAKILITMGRTWGLIHIPHWSVDRFIKDGWL